MAQSAYRQDMPPEGGYRSVAYKRVPGQQYFTSRFLAVYLGSLTFISFLGYWSSITRYRHRRLDNADRELAIQPFMIAERDRAYLKYLKKSREEEEKIAELVPNWKVGQFYNMPLYKTLPDDYHLDPCVNDYFAHSSKADAGRIWAFPSVNFHGINLYSDE